LNETKRKKRRNGVCIREEEVVERESFALAPMMIKMVVLASKFFYSRTEDVKEKKYII
jgi:putative SOS response-associated peptidase YedK